MKKEMLINCLQSEEIRIAIIENGVLEELYVERASHESYVGNIYKGRVVNIEPSIQAAFVDFGVGRNGFLHVSDVEPAYYRHIETPSHGRGGRGERGGRDRGGRGGRDRGDRSDRGERGERGERGRGRAQPRYDEDMPARRYAPPESEPELDQEAPPQSHELPPAPPIADGPDIIVEEIYDEEDPFYQAEAEPEAAPMREPTGLAEDWPAPMETPQEVKAEAPPPAQTPAEAREEPRPEPGAEPAEQPAKNEETEAPAADAKQEEEAEEGKPRRKPVSRAKSKTARPKKPRKKPGADESSAEEPKARPMDSSERRTGEDDPSLGPIEPRPASRDDWSDDDLSFSRAPTPAPVPPQPPRPEPVQAVPSPVEPLAAEAEPEIEDVEDVEMGPLEPAIPKNEPEESLEELVEEEKSLGDETEEEIAVSEIGGDEEHEAEAHEEYGERAEYAPRERGRGGRDRDRDRDRGRGGRDRDRDRDRGRGRGGRGRGGRDAGRDAGRGGRPGMLRPKPHIEDIFKRGQEVLVQVIKEGIGTKGPTLSTYISIAGRYLVLMPGLNRIGVSRKIDDEETRRRLREIMNELKPPRGIGFIIRTAGQDRDSKELQSDLSYLSRLWEVVVRRIKKQKSPCEIYKESDMVTRTIRDIFTSDIDTIWVDEKGAYEAAKEFMEAVMPRYADRIKFYDGAVPMFHKYGIEAEIARIQQRKISLPHGGSIVIDQTEALVAIDVNSGNFRADNNNAEETAYQMNLQAAKEIARQLRLRDLGGVIVNDFIDMREDRHRRGVEKALRDAVQRDRARTKILRISQFGLIEMTRQRIRPSLKRSAFQECTHCHGTGHIKTCESVAIEVMRMLQLAVHAEHIARIDIRVHDDVAQYLLNRKRKEIVSLEEPSGKIVAITSAGAAVSPESLEFLCYDNNGNEVKFTPTDEPPPRPPQRRRGGH